MPKFLTTIKTSAAIEDVIRNAKEKIILISPFLRLTDILLLRLRDAAAKKIPITIIYGKKDLNDNEMKQLVAIQGIQLRFLQNLHAKCYFNEFELVISSMNMYEFSERNNHEMGVLFSAESDSDVYESAVEEAESFIRNSKPVGQQKSEAITVVKPTVPANILTEPAASENLLSFADFQVNARNMDYSNWKEILTSWIGRILEYKYAGHYEKDGVLYFKTGIINFGCFFGSNSKGTFFTIRLDCTDNLISTISSHISYLLNETGAQIRLPNPQYKYSDISINYEQNIKSNNFGFINNEDIPTIVKTISCALYILIYTQPLVKQKQAENSKVGIRF